MCEQVGSTCLAIKPLRAGARSRARLRNVELCRRRIKYGPEMASLVCCLTLVIGPTTVLGSLRTGFSRVIRGGTSGGVAQLGERVNGIHEVRGSIPLASTARRSAEPDAGIAQLVEHNLAKVGVAGSSPVSRSLSGEASKVVGRFVVALTFDP